jgi:hypothetical protein
VILHQDLTRKMPGSFETLYCGRDTIVHDRVMICRSFLERKIIFN